MVRRSIVMLLVLMHFHQILLAEESSKKTKLILDNLVKEIDAVEILETDLKFTEEPHGAIINGKVQQLVDLDNSWKVHFELFHSENKDGEEKKVFSMPAKGVCDLLKSYYKAYFYDSLKDYANAPEPTKCPLTIETYTVTNYPLDTGKFEKMLKPGYFRAIITLCKDNEEKLKYVVESHVEKE